jgi:arginine decarboxylase
VLRGIHLAHPHPLRRHPETPPGELQAPFDTAIAEHKYQGGYCCVYPIKVNQQRQVVEEVLEFGKPFHFGLEAGSKPELMAVMALADNDTPIICNGFKDDEYIEMAMLAQKVGRQIIPVVEKYTELRLILKYSQKVGVRPSIGLRVKLASRGAGRWKSSGGYRSKFGLSATEAMRALPNSRRSAWPIASSCSTSTSAARSPTSATSRPRSTKPSAIYVDLARAGGGCSTSMSAAASASTTTAPRPISNPASTTPSRNTPTTSSTTSRTSATKAEVAHPTIVTESGRAIAAYHSVLVFNVLGVAGMGEADVPPSSRPMPSSPSSICRKPTARSAKNLLESYHDAQQALDQALNLFSLGYLPLEQRCSPRISTGPSAANPEDGARAGLFPEELEVSTPCSPIPTSTEHAIAAIKQLFPIMPIHRLEEEPTCSATSPAIAKWTSSTAARQAHPSTFDGGDYYLGAFLLPRRSSATCTTCWRQRRARRELFKGDTVREVLNYVPDSLVAMLRRDVETALRESRLTYEESGALLKFYEEGLHGYTYLEDVHEQ